MKRTLFEQARLKLTGQFTLVVLGIGLIFSWLFYERMSLVLRLEYERINLRWQREEQGLGPPPMMPRPRRLEREDIETAQKRMIGQLVIINGLVVGLAAVAGYWLSGLTLKPIKEAMEEQKRFVGDAAHELKTPITALKTTLEVNLMDKNLDKKNTKIFKENLEDVNHLEGLTEGLLKLAQVEAEPLKLKPTVVKAFINPAVKQARPLAKQKNIQLKLKIEDPDLQVKGDSQALADLMLIILDNAIKYSPQQSQVEVTTETRQNQLVVSVSDQGIGIAPEHQPQIFSRFYQVDPARTKNNDHGFGLGLALAQQIVKQHHGEIKVTSQVGQGSRFVITLPLV
ncbi:hypothetical protein A2W24_03920 [Microgenomates group bacterium RBG_16_45_19]|nr:MAG: hypothetical protein A2W24_03920 [Microgenomates group bacterium RBG_16_45_19]